MPEQTTSQLLAQGLAHHRAGRAREAEAAYRQVLQGEPNHVDALSLLGVIAGQTGRAHEAVDLIRRAAASRPNDAALLANLGTALRQSGRNSEAIDAYRKALSIRQDPQLLIQFSEALWQAGNAQEAEQALLRALQIERDCVPALYRIGAINANLGYYERAADALKRAVTLDPNLHDACRLLGDSLYQIGRLKESVHACRRAIELMPTDTVSLNHLAMSLQKLGRSEKALPYFTRVIDVPANSADDWFNRALALSGLHRVPEAADAYRRSLALQPDSIRARMNLGVMCGLLGKHREAMECYAHALSLAPNFAAARLQYALSLMQAGKLKEGFAEYGSRWNAITHMDAPRAFAQPLWRGQDVKGKRLLLHPEQGLGDAIQIARYAPLAAQRGARVILDIQPELVSIMRSLEGVEQVIPFGQPLPDFDVHAPLMDLPMIFGTTLLTIPAQVPYLHADGAKVAAWAARLAADEPQGRKALRVGLVWAGSPTNPLSRSRSVSLAALVPLANAAEGQVNFYSLQKGPAAQQATTPPAGMILRDYTMDLRDFSDTAALLMNLDLLISIDTSTAHLAGALGMPVWTLIHIGSDWRWLEDREDSPWYPTMRLFRQRNWNEWPEVIERVAAELQKKVSQRPDNNRNG